MSNGPMPRTLARGVGDVEGGDVDRARHATASNALHHRRSLVVALRAPGDVAELLEVLSVGTMRGNQS